MLSPPEKDRDGVDSVPHEQVKEAEDQALLAQAEAILDDPNTTWRPLEEVETSLGL